MLGIFGEANAAENYLKKHGLFSLLVLSLFVVENLLLVWLFSQEYLVFFPSSPIPYSGIESPKLIDSTQQTLEVQQMLLPQVQGQTINKFNWTKPEKKSLRLFTVTPDGYYCPKSNINYTSPDLWQEEPVRLVFGTLPLKVAVKSDGISGPPTFIISLGKEKRIFRLHIGEGNPQLVGFEKMNQKDPTGELIREAPQELTHPLESDTILNITMYSRLKGNVIEYTFDVEYIAPDGTGAVPDTFVYEVALDDPAPETASAQIGIGTLKGRCFAILE